MTPNSIHWQQHICHDFSLHSFFTTTAVVGMVLVMLLCTINDLFYIEIRFDGQKLRLEYFPHLFLPLWHFHVQCLMHNIVSKLFAHQLFQFHGHCYFWPINSPHCGLTPRIITIKSIFWFLKQWRWASSVVAFQCSTAFHSEPQWYISQSKCIVVHISLIAYISHPCL